MSPKISFRVKNNTLRVRIKINGDPESVFDTGMACDPDKFDADKQICGIPSVQQQMQYTLNSLKNLFTPGLHAKELWETFIQNQKAYSASHTVRDAFMYYFDTAKVKPSTISNKRTLFVQLEKKGLSDKPIKEMNGAAIRSFISSLGISESSEHAVYTRLNTVLSYYASDHDIDYSVRKKIFTPAAYEPDDDAYLTWNELKTLLTTKLEDEEDQIWVNFFCFMCLTGMSVSDALKFDPVKHISGQFIKYSRKKTSTPCVVPLFDVTQQVIENIKWPVRYTSRTVQNKCSGLISDLVGRKMKSHGGRKTFGAICLEMGYSIESVAKFMGHTTPIITSKIYAKVTLAKIEREMRELPESAKQMMKLKI